ncbi:hypothetical protein B0H13DRAFT_2305195 [Mycena leptocephala]|nr:hypothetical protein B0H13DRAFT_2305195 [Mycena leptocephala]
MATWSRRVLVWYHAQDARRDGTLVTDAALRDHLLNKLHSGQTNYRLGAWTGAPAAKRVRGRRCHGRRIWRLHALLADGCRYLEWNGRDSKLIVDADGHIIAVLLGPEGDDWGRQRRPGNLAHSKEYRQLLRHFLQSWAAGRIAGFQSSGVARYFPKLSKYMAQTMHGIEANQSGLCRPFKNSVYPAVTFNLGPDTVTAEHRDSHNLAHGLKVVIEFPSGSTMGILSGALDHGNTPIAKGETRYSMTQYAAGALFRWAAYGYKTARTALETAGGAEKKASFDGDPGVRAAWVVNLLSKADEVEANRAAMFDNAPP